MTTRRKRVDKLDDSQTELGREPAQRIMELEQALKTGSKIISAKRPMYIWNIISNNITTAKQLMDANS
jgi:hypothetical protein